jgi:O-antigen ligase
VLLAGAVAGILLGALQVSSANPELSPWYLYADTNFGAATGFFANANHMADLLVVTLPFLAAALAQSGDRERTPQQHSAALVVFAGAVLVIAVGIALNGSLAGYGLAIPVLAASALIAFPARRLSRWLAPGAAILFIAAIGWLSTTPLSNSQQLSSTASSSVQSRREILATSLKTTGDFMPFGSGIGTFQRVYALHEDHDRLNPTIYVNHAHNDYIEMALEMGLPGVILIGLFLLWWARAAWTKWPTKSRDPYARAAVVASAAMLLHSVVDFPLRTAALSACFAMCLALLARPKREPRKDKSRLWATRHVVIE